MIDFQKEVIQNVLNILGAIGWAVGIVSGWLQWKGYRNQKQMEGAYRNVLEQAQRDWRGRYTEEQVEELTVQFRRLGEQIRRDIPQQARRVFLEDKRSTIADSINELYQQYDDMNSELAKLSTPEFLDPKLRDAIEQQILPAYRERQRQQRILYILVIAILVFTVFPFIVDFIPFSIRIPFVSQFFPTGNLLAYLSGIVLAVFIAYSIPIRQSRQIVKRYRLVFVLLGILSLAIWIGAIYVVGFEPIHLHRDWEIIGAVASLVPFALGIRILSLTFSRTI